MPRGGRRPGSGRKKGSGKVKGSGAKAGSVTLKSREVADRVAAGLPIGPPPGPTISEKNAAITPLDVMIQNMRHAMSVAEDAERVLAEISSDEIAGRGLEPAEQFKVLLAEVKKTVDLRQVAQECARDAAPYVHARIAAVAVKAGDSAEEIVPLAERLKIYARRDAIQASEGKVVELKKAGAEG